MPSNPNVNSGASDVGSGGEDDVDDGEADETNGLLTGETDNFNDQGHSQDTAKSNAASDQGPAE
ncbi:MAG TPA: hypothetical protein VF278_11330 [Pirellulales bacterium]